MLPCAHPLPLASQFPMHNYPLFMNMMSCVIYVPLSFAYIIPMQLFTKTITKEQTDIPKYKFAGMRFCQYICTSVEVVFCI